MSFSRGPAKDPFTRPASRVAPPGPIQPGLSGVRIWEEKPPAAREPVTAGVRPPQRRPPAARMEPSAERPPEVMAPSGFITRYPAYIIGFFVVCFGYLLFLQTQPEVVSTSFWPGGFLRAVDDALTFSGAAVCAVVSLRTAFKLRREMLTSLPGMMVRRAWLGWLFIGCAAITYSIGQFIWTGFDAQTSSFPYPAIYDPFYLAVYPFGWVGIALLIPRIGSAAGRTRLLLDAGIVVASALALSWYFILGPTILGLSGTPLQKIVSLAYPLGDLSLCVASALLIFGPAGVSRLSGPIWRVGIGVTILAITDSLYGFFQILGTYHTGFLQDGGWPVAWLFVGWGALVYPAALASLTGQRLPAEQTRKTLMTTTNAVVRSALPITITLFTCILLSLEVALRGTAPLAQIVVVCAILFVMPIIRQVLTLVDNLILNDRLRVALGQSQQAFQQSQQELVQTSTRAQQYDELRASIEDLQSVHAKLARGDLSVRAHVDGPLSPVAQSLNLLIERLQRWAQFEQANRTLEEEANRLREILDELSEGHLAPLPTARSILPTGAALVSSLRLQRQLAVRFLRMREGLEMLGTRWKLSKDAVRQAEQLLRQAPSNQEVLAALEALTQVEQKLDSNQAILQDFWMQTKAYQDSAP